MHITFIAQGFHPVPGAGDGGGIVNNIKLSVDGKRREGNAVFRLAEAGARHSCQRILARQDGRIGDTAGQGGGNRLGRGCGLALGIGIGIAIPADVACLIGLRDIYRQPLVAVYPGALRVIRKHFALVKAPDDVAAAGLLPEVGALQRDDDITHGRIGGGARGQFFARFGGIGIAIAADIAKFVLVRIVDVLPLVGAPVDGAAVIGQDLALGDLGVDGAALRLLPEVGVVQDDLHIARGRLPGGRLGHPGGGGRIGDHRAGAWHHRGYAAAIDLGL